jgi:hypothetical protein
MAIIRISNITATGSAFNLNLGFTPNYIKVINQTKLAAQTGVAVSEWFSSMPNGYALIQTLTAGAPVYSQITTNGFTPFSSADGTLYTPTNKAIAINTTGITQAANALVTTAASHGFTTSDIGVTTVTFHGVVGMTQINTLSGVIQSVPSATTFTVNINTTAFSAFVQSGNPLINVITGIPPVTQTGFQVYNTPLLNNGFVGLTFGSSVCGSASDVLQYIAVLDADFTSQ